MGKITLTKVPTNDNLADALTKGVDVAILNNHIAGIGAEILQGRHELAPQ